MKVFQPIQKASDLPAIGTAEGTSLDFKAVLDPKWTQFQLACKVAAFANSVGGTLVIGAGEDGKDALKKYVPMNDAVAKAVEKKYGDAIQRCSPKPFIEPVRIPMDGDFVVAINVWPFPGQAVGVRGSLDKSIDGKRPDAYVFPLRVGRDTREILPEQLPMLMLPELRRVAIVLDGVSRDTEVETWPSDGASPPVTVKFIRVDLLTNTVLFIRHGQGNVSFEVGVPLDRIESVWRGSEGWKAVLRGRIKSLQNRIDFLP